MNIHTNLARVSILRERSSILRRVPCETLNTAQALLDPFPGETKFRGTKIQTTHRAHKYQNTKQRNTITITNTNTITNSTMTQYPIEGDESIMSEKKHGTSETPVQKDLRWGCDFDTADRICNYNRHYAEHSGYFVVKTSFVKYAQDEEGEITFYDSNTGKELFNAPRGRSMDDFLKESRAHGWPSFRDQEVNWDYVRCLPGGEAVSVDGTHLGHNLPDRKGNRYCINLVSVAGKPV